MITLRDAKERQGKDWVATVGFFDGVHQGHRFLIEEMRRLAAERDLPSAVFTFAVHPRVVLQSDYQPKLLNSFDEKLTQLATTGVDYCVVLDFTSAMAALSARDFIVNVLSSEWHVHTLLVGYDHRFGHNRVEGFEEYVKYGAECGMEVLQANAQEMNGNVISSSKIRELLSLCEVEKAAQLLTYPYRLKGHIVSGHQIGRTIGFPTANIAVDEPFKVWPGNGVYAVWAYFRGERSKGMLTIGNRPTLDGGAVSVEVHLLHFSGMIYEEEIEVEFIKYLRENKRFDDLEALKVQLEADRTQVENILK